MEPDTHPGKGKDLSLSQLVFTPNVELDDMTHSSSLTADQVAKGISTASAPIDERRNALAPVNLLPLDVLLLIATHLPSLSDRLRATFVCRRWRHAFVQHAQLWSQLYVTEKTDQHLLTTLLERAKRFPLDITFRSPISKSRIHDMMLLSPLTQQIRSLDVEKACAEEIKEISAAFSGFLPLLDTVTIEENGFNVGSYSTLSLFEGAVNVKNFALYTYTASSLSLFNFKNLTIFKFGGGGGRDKYSTCLLLDFLEASPSLQEISIKITDVFNEDVPPDRLLLFPCVKVFRLTLLSNSGGWKFATHLSCPSAERVQFTTKPGYSSSDIPEVIFPPSNQWSAIARQYTTGTTNEVELILGLGETLACAIVFRSINNTRLMLYYGHPIESRSMRLARKIASTLFSRASGVLLNHPLLANIGSLCIKENGLLSDNIRLTANKFGKLIGSMGPLDDLHLVSCDLRPYLDPFLETSHYPDAIRPTSFPAIKRLTIFRPTQSLSKNEHYAAAIVTFAKSQHARGKPFECVRLRPTPPSWLVEELSLSVDVVDFDQILSDGGEGQN